MSDRKLIDLLRSCLDSGQLNELAIRRADVRTKHRIVPTNNAARLPARSQLMTPTQSFTAPLSSQTVAKNIYLKVILFVCFNSFIETIKRQDK